MVVGIGNPGVEYEQTRHNVGFMVLDRLAARMGLHFARLDRRELGFSGKAKAQIAFGGRDGATPFVLVKPLTYVNLSGQAVGPFLRAHELPPESLFVVVDDLNLPLGRIRIRPAGRSGGHNGLQSIQDALTTAEYPRLRLGIGHASADQWADHVLGAFSEEEREVLGSVLERATDAVSEWLGGASLQSLMERHNGGGRVDLEEDL
ncbi:MAG: aminoacyl-tRNA hydrolase [Planctomycetota bacterium]